jgi:hypothetical protein
MVHRCDGDWDNLNLGAAGAELGGQGFGIHARGKVEGGTTAAVVKFVDDVFALAQAHARGGAHQLADADGVATAMAAVEDEAMHTEEFGAQALRTFPAISVKNRER